MTTNARLAASIDVGEMTNMKDLIFACVLILTAAAIIPAQPRPADVSLEDAKAAPSSFKAKYEGGLIGFNKKEEGRLAFDEDNERIVFYSEEGVEWFGISYKMLLSVSPQSRSVTSNTGNVIRHIPLPGAILGGFIKEKRRYLVLQFEDPDVDIRGIASFKVNDKELLDSVIAALGKKAKLMKRGDAFIRQRNKSGPDTDNNNGNRDDVEDN